MGPVERMVRPQRSRSAENDRAATRVLRRKSRLCLSLAAPGDFGVDMMKCKKGDLAVIVHSYAGNEGKIVRCLRISEPDFFNPIDDGPRWLVDKKLTTSNLRRTRTVADSQLRPLRYSDGEDEILRLVGKPVDSLVEA